MKIINHLLDQIGNLRSRERTAILALGLLALILPAESWLISPAFKEVSKLHIERNEVSLKESALKAELKNIEESNELKKLQSSVDSRRHELDVVLGPLVTSARARLISPDQVDSFLRDMVAKAAGLKLLMLSSEPGVKDERAKDLWRHPFVVELEGEYAEISRHMAQLKSSSWRLASERMVLETQEKTSRIKMKLRINAFSDSPTWIAQVSTNNKVQQ